MSIRTLLAAAACAALITPVFVVGGAQAADPDALLPGHQQPVIGAGGAPHAAVGSAAAADDKAWHASAATAKGEEIDLGGIERAEGGKTVAEIFDGKTELAGETVAVRGKVVKSNNAIMGKNWLHVRDGSAALTGENDLTVTTAGTAKVGDTVVVTGKLALDQEFGYGYSYPVLLEDAAVTVE